MIDIKLLSILMMSIIALRIFTISYSINFFKQGFAGDASVHIKIIDYFRKYKFQRKRIDNYVIPGIIFYPLGFHSFCSLLSNKLLIKRPYIPNLLIYTLMVFFLYFNTVYIFSLNNINTSILPFIVIILFSLSSQNLITKGPAVAYIKLSERLLGKFCSSLFFLNFLFYYHNSDTILLLITIGSACLIILTSKFAIQTLFFICIVITIFKFDLIPILVLSTGLFLSIIITKGYSFHTFINTFKFISIYKNYIYHSKYAKQGFKSFISLQIIKENFTQKKFFSIFKNLSFNEPLRSLFFYPEIYFIILFPLFFSSDISSLQYTLLIFVLSTLLIYLITSSKIFCFAGEGYRYIEYSLGFILPFFTLLLSSQSDHFHVIIISFILYHISFSFLFQNFIGKKFSPQSKSDPLSEFLNIISIDESDTVFPVSMRLGADIVARTNCKSFWWQPGGLIDHKTFREYIFEYPFLSTDWITLCRKHNVTKIIVDKSYQREADQLYDFSSLRKIYSNNRYAAFHFSHNGQIEQNKS